MGGEASWATTGCAAPGEHCCRQKPLSYHAERLPRGVTWYADPSGANERCELRWASFTVAEGSNAIRPGIAAVSARLENGTLKVVEGTCPNLLWEAHLYRYGEGGREGSAEAPIDEHNHALGALRYLISGVDGKGAVWRRRRKPAEVEEEPKPQGPWWLREDREGLWTPLW
jgi:hypothetical protein